MNNFKKENSKVMIKSNLIIIINYNTLSKERKKNVDQCFDFFIINILLVPVY